jgi:hypothetical protein
VTSPANAEPAVRLMTPTTQIAAATILFRIVVMTSRIRSYVEIRTY